MSTEKSVYSIDEFCAAYGISRPLLYILWRSGEGPESYHVRHRRFITPEAAEKWQRQYIAGAKRRREIEKEVRRRMEAERHAAA